MLARIGIEAGILEHKPGHRLSAHNMGFDDLIHIRGGYVPVPDSLWIDDHIGSMLALVEAAGLIGTDSPLQAMFS